jgi:hypothetical protein
VSDEQRPDLVRSYTAWRAQPWHRRVLPWWLSTLLLLGPLGRELSGAAHGWAHVADGLFVLVIFFEIYRDLRRRRRAG